MKKSTVSIIVVVVVLVALLGGGCRTYNSLVTLEQDVDAQWAKVEVQYQRRLDLIPNLVETVKGYAAHESNTLESVTRARAGLTDAYNTADSLKNTVASGNAQAFESYNAAQSSLNRALSLYVNAVHEAYPDLKANTNFKDLQTQLEGTENRIATERGRYAEVVKDYNVAIRKFPRNIVAGLFGFQAKPQFQAEAAAQSAPKVQF
ncbi:MAG: LemA family protein [Muribaculaceae bacterium]|nr:LemA family protein [Muribaculaceae bacterium]